MDESHGAEERAARLIERLADSACYDHQTHDIQVIETHISWVILTGTYVYKLKKPVDLGFLDFTSLSQRQYYCEEELRINRRLAPEIYLAVVPVTGTPEAPGMNGTAPVIDYAVCMQQFPRRALLADRVDSGALTAEVIDRLVEIVANFHASVARASADDHLGGPEAAHAPVVENFEQIKPHIGESEPGRRLDDLWQWSNSQYERIGPTLAHRKREGFVRECHGDMHLGNIAKFDDRIVIFDGIEFSENLRWIDVVSEIALMMIDLDHYNRSDLAYRFLNGYLEKTGDYCGVVLLDYFRTYRAMVRAKVACLRCSQMDEADPDRQRKEREFTNYLTQAARYTEPTAPYLIITRGLSGSGKTALTQPAAEALGAIRIRSDLERKRLLPTAPQGYHSRPATGIYTAEATAQTYSRLHELADSLLAGGWPAIVDATFLDQAQRDVFRGLAHGHGVPFLVLDIQAPEAQLRQRVARRDHQDTAEASDAGLEILEHQLKSYRPLGDEERDEAMVFANSGSIVSGMLTRRLEEWVAARHSTA